MISLVSTSRIHLIPSHQSILIKIYLGKKIKKRPKCVRILNGFPNSNSKLSRYADDKEKREKSRNSVFLEPLAIISKRKKKKDQSR